MGLYARLTCPLFGFDSMKRLSVCIVLLLLSSTTAFADFTGLVVSIIDGDTMIVLKDGVEEVIRLNGIDCPEKNQVHGNNAKQFTSNRALNTVVTVEAKEVDRDGRTIADVILADGTNLNRELVKEGLAWWFFKYSKDGMLRALEMEARDGKRGLWENPLPMPPWVFRKIHRKQVPDISDFQYPGTLPSGVLANKKSHVYLYAECKNYNAMLTQKNVVRIDTVEDAVEAGYHPANDCPGDIATR
jgi:endonuclease YncB( thermonuclease family)